MLQALGGGLISKDMAMRELPFTVNVTQELEKIEIENLRSGLLSSLGAIAQAIPQMVTQGQDPTDIISKVAAVIKARQKGQAIEDVIGEIFAPKPEVPPAGAPASMVEQPSPAPAGMSAGGALPPGGGAPPDIQTLLSSLSSGGAANATVRTSRKQ
jgi:hypothetical protein